MLLSKRLIYAIAAIVDIAIHAPIRPVAAKKLSDRLNLPPRHLEPVLQALVHEGLLKSVRGPKGGYVLGRERRKILLSDIYTALNALDATDTQMDCDFINHSIVSIINPKLEKLKSELSNLSVEEFYQKASSQDEEKLSEADFSI